jgi:hypothetical protein
MCALATEQPGFDPSMEADPMRIWHIVIHCPLNSKFRKEINERYQVDFECKFDEHAEKHEKDTNKTVAKQRSAGTGGLSLNIFEMKVKNRVRNRR